MATTVNSVTQERLHELLEYNPVTGIFVHKKRKQGTKVGEEAGSVDTRGYRVMSILGVRDYAHRLAYIYKYGSIPDGYVIDHIDRNKGNNSIGNIRLATSSSNSQNKIANGYCYIEARNMYQAYIETNNTRVHLGYFNTKEEASLAYKEARERTHDIGDNILSVFQVPMSMDTGVRKKKTMWLNSNNLHVLHHQAYNTAKRKFKILVAKELEVRDIKYTDNYIVEYLIFLPDKLKRDIANVGSVLQKFTDDAYVELGFAKDDNYHYLQKSTYKFGGYDPNKKGFAQVTIRENIESRQV